MVYVAAAAEATVGGDLYEAVATGEHGIRVIMGDVRGKGLGAVELATDVLGMFREQAHDADTLAELAARLDTGLGRNLARHEEFVTALLVEIDPESGKTSVFNCGHPPPLLIPAVATTARTRRMTLMEVPALKPLLAARPAHPRRHLGARSCPVRAAAGRPASPLHRRRHREARDAKRAFYLRLPERVSALTSAKGGREPGRRAGRAYERPVSGGNGRQGLLDLVSADLRVQAPRRRPARRRDARRCSSSAPPPHKPAARTIAAAPARITA